MNSQKILALLNHITRSEIAQSCRSFDERQDKAPSAADHRLQGESG
jgi:hypothetical protein